MSGWWLAVPFKREHRASPRQSRNVVFLRRVIMESLLCIWDGDAASERTETQVDLLCTCNFFAWKSLGIWMLMLENHSLYLDDDAVRVRL